MPEDCSVGWANPYTRNEVRHLRSKGNRLGQSEAFPTNGAGTAGRPHAKRNKTQTLLTPFPGMNSEWTTGVSVKRKTIQLFGDSTGENRDKPWAWLLRSSSRGMDRTTSNKRFCPETQGGEGEAKPRRRGSVYGRHVVQPCVQTDRGLSQLHKTKQPD